MLAECPCASAPSLDLRRRMSVRTQVVLNLQVVVLDLPGNAYSSPSPAASSSFVRFQLRASSHMAAALPTKLQVDEALNDLAEAAKSYSDAPDLAGYASRVEVIARAKSLIRSVVSPDMMPNYHGLNVRCRIALPVTAPSPLRTRLFRERQMAM